MTTSLRAILTLVVAVAASCAGSRLSKESPVVSTERINWCGANWITSFTSTEVVQKVDDTCIRPGRYTQRFTPTRSQWADVQLALESNNFGTLPEEITTPPDAEGRIAIVTDDPKSCITFAARRVCGESHALNHTPEGERFIKIWSTLTAIAPEPEH